MFLTICNPALPMISSGIRNSCCPCTSWCVISQNSTQLTLLDDAGDLILIAAGDSGVYCYDHTNPADPFCDALILKDVDAPSLHFVPELISNEVFWPTFDADAPANAEIDPMYPENPAWTPTLWYAVRGPDNKAIPRGISSLMWTVSNGVPITTGFDTTIQPTGYIDTTLSLTSLSATLEEISLTPNAVITIWDSAGVIAVSRADQLLNVTRVGSDDVFMAYQPETHPLEVISVPASSFKEQYGEYRNYPSSTEGSFETSKGTVWVQLRRIRDYALDWYILVSVPASDIDAPIAASRRKVIVTSVVIAVAMLAFAAASSFVVTMPLRKLSSGMKQATKMDFSALKDGYLDRRTLVSELSDIQGVFVAMLEKFAEAIRSNKKLVNRPAGSMSSSNRH